MTLAMKKLLIILMLAIASINGAYARTSSHSSNYTASEFEQAVELIKKYETLHTAKNWPLIGYGHKVQPGENIAVAQPCLNRRPTLFFARISRNS